MSFFAEIVDRLGLSETNLSEGYQAICFNGEAIYIEGFSKILSLTQSEIAFKVGSGRFCVAGEGLSIFLLEPSSVIIKGRIDVFGQDISQKRLPESDKNLGISEEAASQQKTKKRKARRGGWL